MPECPACCAPAFCRERSCCLGTYEDCSPSRFQAVCSLAGKILEPQLIVLVSKALQIGLPEPAASIVAGLKLVRGSLKNLVSGRAEGQIESTRDIRRSGRFSK